MGHIELSRYLRLTEEEIRTPLKASQERVSSLLPGVMETDNSISQTVIGAKGAYLDRVWQNRQGVPLDMYFHAVTGGRASWRRLRTVVSSSEQRWSVQYSDSYVANPAVAPEAGLTYLSYWEGNILPSGEAEQRNSLFFRNYLDNTYWLIDPNGIMRPFYTYDNKMSFNSTRISSNGVQNGVLHLTRAATATSIREYPEEQIYLPLAMQPVFL